MPCGASESFHRYCLYHLFGVPLVSTNHTRKMFWYLSLLSFFPYQYIFCLLFLHSTLQNQDWFYLLGQHNANKSLLLVTCKRTSPGPLPLHLLTREGQPPWGDLLKAVMAQGSFSEKEKN